jgi:hypothetical protein
MNTEDTTNTEPPTNTEETAETTDEAPDTFPRHVVEDLRKEAAGYRDRAKTAEARAEDLARQLFTARVAATGKLADPTDFPYSPDDADLLDNPDALAAAVDELIAAKPHLKSRTPVGDIGQGKRGSAEKFNLLEQLKTIV